MVYIKAPNLNNTGYINPNYNDYLRMKQGLMPQNLASDCFSPPNWSSYSVPVNMPYSCMGENKYPIKLPRPNYGNKPPSDNIPCTRYVQSA